MSTFKDIEEAYLKYAQTRNWGDVNYGLIYTCNGGWLDLGHLNPNSTRTEIGAANLWRSLLSEGPAMKRQNCTMEAPTFLQAPGVAALKYFSNCGNDPYVRFADGSSGFAIRYRQDHGGYPGKPGREGKYLIKYGLTRDQKKSIGLSIFMDVSHDFERFQNSALGRLVTDSGYSAEDLVSNLIGFYIAVGVISKTDAIAACQPVSRETAERIWRNNGAVGSNKNTTFEPHLFNSGYSDPIAAMCRDDCALSERRFPVIFNSIRPAINGQLFRRVDWPE